jgi:hypothetical protein
LAGIFYLAYIAAAFPSMVITDRAAEGEGTAAKLAGIARHAASIRATVVLAVVCFVCAVGLAVTLYALTRDEDRDIALLAFCCRLTEGVMNASSALQTLGLLSVATAATAASGADAAGYRVLGAFLLRQESHSFLIGGTVFAIGSTLFCWLFLRARSIPVPLAWLGVVGSALIAVALPVQAAGGPTTMLIWIPIFLFEVSFAVWLIVKGVAEPGARSAPLANP